MTNESSPLEQWNVTGKAERNVYTGNYGPILPNNQGTVNINTAPAPKVDRPPSNIPFLGTDSFVGRDLDLVRLHEQLQQDNRIVITAVTGMGGVGKTELAVQYAQRYWQATFPGGVCWLSARGAEGDADIGTQIITFGKSYLGLNPPEELDAKDQVAFCWRQWPRFDVEAQEPEPVLVVLDDVTNYRQVEPYLPHDQRFTVLMTTRVELGSRIAKLPIGVLARADALELLRQLAGAERINAELETADALCEWLGDLPLGLELVGRYLAWKQDWSLAKLREKLEERELQARALTRIEEGMTASLGVASAFELSWQELSEEAQELACLLSCFALAPIPWEGVKACLPEADPEELEDWRDDELVRLSLLKRVETERYQYHQLIQRFIRTKLSNESPWITLYCLTMAAAAREFERRPTRANILAWSIVIPHIVEAVKHWLTHIPNDELIRIFTGLGRFYDGQGLYNQAKAWFEECLLVTRKVLGEKHPDAATSLHNLANAHYSLGKYDEAETLLQEALELKKLMGEGNSSIINSLNNLALVYRSQGKYSEAELLYQKNLELNKRFLGENHLNTALSTSNLAMLYCAKGKYSDAELLLQDALELYKKQIGYRNLDVARCLNNLANIYYNQGKYSEAELLLKEALELNKQLLGDKHPEIANGLNNLAELYRTQKKYQHAKPLFQEALDLYKEFFGDEHPNIASSLSNLALIYSAQRRYKKAEYLFQKALEIRKRIVGKEHPDVATSLHNLADLYREQRKYKKAEILYLKALKMSDKFLGEEHPDIASSLNSLAVLYSMQGRYKEAERLHHKALKMRKDLLGEKHPGVAIILNNLAIIYDAQKRYSQAELFYVEALVVLCQHFDQNNPTIQKILRDFTGFLQTVLKNKRTADLSNHPLTQQLLAQLQLQFQPPES